MNTSTSEDPLWLVSGSLFILSLEGHTDSFTIPEIITMAISFTSLENKAPNIPLLYATFFAFAFNTRPCVLQMCSNLLLLGYEPHLATSIIYDFIMKDFPKLIYLAVLLCTCLCVQISAYFILGANMRRKIFHFFGFFFFYTISPPELFILQHLMYFFIVLSQTKIPAVLFREYLSPRDFGGGIYSHIFLIGGLAYPSLYLQRDNYIKFLVTVCFMDAFAAITGIFFKTRTKSFQGLFGGQVASYLLEHIISARVDAKYRLSMGLIEYLLPINDNILLPFASVVYFSTKESKFIEG